jgi:hypothetical protein
MVWAYLSFMQYLIIWSGDLPEEVTWVASRTRGGWQVLAVALVTFQFALPFSLLLFRTIKTRRRSIIPICALILGLRFIEQYWLVAPAFSPGHLHLNPWLLPTFLTLGAVWYFLFSSYRHMEGSFRV